ncbi:LIM domain only protein 3-like isoform X1 [Maniola hyperantus]|uniref:LIM domain only protein 3-like isoform X1 n=1 Tax=Aphantopus hyperantus TaxID=2795564 RepID=UPI00156838D8|nr:LIM domain only protein 3-like [Maniola hyperantus]XP_034825781.1 LIM domain only protein 3-like [Maniola hyperantus]
MIRDPPAMHKPDNANSQQEDKYALSGGVANPGGTRLCAQCGKVITERFLLKAMERFWHEDCLKCGCCDCRLGEVGSKLYYKADLMLCKRDYLRLFGATGNCVACNKVIPAFEMVMRAKSFVYHLECFACQQCNHRFCVGDRFYLCDNKILCEYDYEERLVFASMAANPSGLAHIRRQVSGLQSPSSAYVGGAAGCVAGGPVGPLVEKDNGGCAGADDASSGYGSPPDPDVCDAAR